MKSYQQVSVSPTAYATGDQVPQPTEEQGQQAAWETVNWTPGAPEFSLFQAD